MSNPITHKAFVPPEYHASAATIATARKAGVGLKITTDEDMQPGVIECRDTGAVMRIGNTKPVVCRWVRV